MITDSYDIETEPMINLFDFHGRRGDFADICLIIFSKEIHRHLLDSYESEIIATMPACNGDTHIYKTLKSASNLNGNLNCSKELEHYAS